MSLFKVLIVAFCVFGSSVLFFSIGKWSNKYVSRDNVITSSPNSIISLHLIGSNELVIAGKTVNLFGVINGKRLEIQKNSDELGYVEFSGLHPGKYIWEVESTQKENGLVQDSVFILDGQELSKTIKIE